MKIAIFDPSGSHWHYVFTLGSVFEGEQIEWFIHKHIYQRLSDLGTFNGQQQGIHICRNRYHKPLFYLRSILNFSFGKWDIIFINTLHANWLLNFLFFVMLKKDVRCVLTIHNINSFFADTRKRGLKAYVKRKTRQIALKKCKMNVYGANLKKHLLSISPEVEVFMLPFQAYDPDILKAPNLTCQTISVVIPGAVDLRRRNYNEVLEIIKETENIPNLQFVLLGRPYGPGALDILKRLEPYGNRVKYYQAFVPEDEFDRQMQSAGIIWGPLQKYFNAGDAIEEYGVSKETGISFAIIRYAIPGVISAGTTVMDEIKSGVKTYSDTMELLEFFKEIAGDRGALSELAKEARANAQKFERTLVRQQFCHQMFNRSPPLAAPDSGKSQEAD